MTQLAEKVRDALSEAVARVEATGEPETVDVLRILWGCDIAEGSVAVRAGVYEATKARRVRAALDLQPGRGGCALVRLERLEDLDVLRAEVKRLRAREAELMTALDAALAEAQRWRDAQVARPALDAGEARTLWQLLSRVVPPAPPARCGFCGAEDGGA